MDPEAVSPAHLPVSPARLPVDEVVGDLAQALDAAGVVVLEAPPGAGKTTRVPLALLERGFAGRLVVLEPRRVAARAAANRLAAQLGERLGDRIGLTTRDERRVSARTRVEVVTEGVLLRRLQRDPSLPGVGTVLFDEFHERNLEGDLALAFALETRSALRPDLRLLVASATLDGARVARLLGDASVVRAEGRAHAVEVVHRDPAGRRDLDLLVRDALVDHLGSGRDDGGDVLVFLPGMREIRRTAATLGAAPIPDAFVVLPLHGALPPREQDAALMPAGPGRRKIVLATDVAESSITIDGVTLVVDTGRSREPVFDAATAMSGLVTRAASRASADQRAGRAGRTAPGRCIRLWAERDHAARDAHPRPAIVTDDLTAAALEVAAWGGEVADLALLDQPPGPAWDRARETLVSLGALDDRGRITAHGRAMADLPVHPRIGHLLLHGVTAGLGPLAAELAAVLADRDLLTTSPQNPCADLAVRVRVLRGEQPPGGLRVRSGARRRALRERDRLARALHVGSGHGEIERIGELVLAAWPERLAGARGERRGSFVLAGGRGAELPEGDLMAGERYLAVAHLDRGEHAARIHLAAPIEEEAIRRQLVETLALDEEIAWRGGEVVAEVRERIGAVVLRQRPLQHPDPDRLHAALLSGIGEEGIEVLRPTVEDRALQGRVALLRRVRGEPWPDLSDDALLRDVADVVGPFLLRARRRQDLASVSVGDALRARLGGALVRDLDRLVPTHLEVPSGSRVRLDYTSGSQPVLAVRLQEMFGARATPSVVDGEVAVLVHLLSPAGRPVQVTDDLAGFWQRTYPEVRSELRGRYPKHAWPQDPLNATALRGTKRGRGNGRR